MRLCRFKGPEAPAWDQYLEASPGGGHFLQTRAWGAMKRHYRWRPFQFMLRDRSGRARGCAQILAYRTPLGKDLLYCPKGPWIDWTDPASVAAFVQGVRAWGARHQAFLLRFDPHVLEQDDGAWDLLRHQGVRRARWEMQYKTGWVVSLRGTEADVLGAMKPKTRYNIRLAERKGIVVRHDSSLEACSQFHAMYVHTAERDGFAPRPAGYVIASCRSMIESGRGTIIWAEHKGKRLAAIVVYAFGRKAWYWLGASSDEQRHLMPAYLVQWEGMRWARARGCAVYDMTGVPSPDHIQEDDPFWGLYRFKSGFGGGAQDLKGTCELIIDPVVSLLWRRVEPAYYRLYQQVHGDVYY